MFLKPDGRIDLDHRADYIRGIPHESVVLAAARDGQVSFLSPDLKEVRLRRLPSKIRAISPHPSDRRLAWVDEKTGSITVQDFDGSQLLEIAPPSIQKTKPAWVQWGFDDCYFDEDGRFLWTITPLESRDVVVQLHEAKTGTMLDYATLKDPFSGSSWSFYSTGKPGLVAIWLAACNPDMVQGFSLKRTGKKFICALESQLTNVIPLNFSPSGDHFLVVNEDHEICKFKFPAMQQVGLPLASGDEDNPFTESLYLDDRLALASTNEGRIFVVDTLHMHIESEVSLEGHEPRPIAEYYPSLAKETGLATDISWFLRLGDIIIFVYRRDRSTGLENWKDTLLWLKTT
jgi:WD40 repeat protein